jgi:hypothetical protein
MSDPIQVECYSGYTYAQEPRAFTWRGQRYEVERVIKRWRTPQGPGFRVEVGRPEYPWPAVQDRQISNIKYQISIPDPKSHPPRLVDLHYLELQDQWTLTVRQPNLIQEDQR